MIVQNLNNLGGANTNLSPLLQPPTSPTVLNGWVDNFKLGALTKDTGYSRVSTVIEASKPITGLFNFRQTGAEKMLATVDDATSDDTQLWYKTSAGAWTEIAAAETAWANKAGINVEMAAFLNYCFFVGYGATDGFLPVGSLTGTTFSTVTNVTDMPQAKYITRYRDKIFIANCRYSGTDYPFRVYFSSVPAAGAITWTPASDFLDVDYSEELTGLSTNWDRLVAFTDNRAYMYDESQWKQVWEIGCANHRTICNQGAMMVWCDYDGVWVSTGGQPQNISGSLIDFIRNGTPRNFFACIVDEEYRLYVGNVTVDGVAYANCELRFNLAISTAKWREYYDTFTIYAPYNDSGKIRQYMGSNNGYVYNKAKYTDSTLISSDQYIDANNLGFPISCNFELAPFFLGSLSRKSFVQRMVAYADRAQGLQLQIRTLDRNLRLLTKYKPIGQLRDFANFFDVNLKEGVLLQIAGSESSKNPYASFYGYELEVLPNSKVK